MKKDYIRDDKRIRNCTSNIAKMNPLEYMWFDIVHNKVLIYGIIETLKQYGEAFRDLFIAILNTILIIFFPVSLLIKGVNVTKNARKQVEMHRKMREK